MRERWNTPRATETGVDTHGPGERDTAADSQISFRSRVIRTAPLGRWLESCLCRSVVWFFASESAVHAKPSDKR